MLIFLYDANVSLCPGAEFLQCFLIKPAFASRKAPDWWTLVRKRAMGMRPLRHTFHCSHPATGNLNSLISEEKLPAVSEPELL